jgi:hypothetical protein
MFSIYNGEYYQLKGEEAYINGYNTRSPEGFGLRCKIHVSNIRSTSSSVTASCVRLIRHLKSRGVLGPVLAPVIQSRGGNIRMPQPFLHFCEVILNFRKNNGGIRPRCFSH